MQQQVAALQQRAVAGQGADAGGLQDRQGEREVPVYWVILVCPAWPSFLRVSSRGITTTMYCRMMLAVM